MHENEAIKSFSQSEKIKSGLIWATQMAEMYTALPESDKPGAERMLKALVGMIGNEIHIAQKSAPNEFWLEAGKDVETALVMMTSGVVHELGYHLTQALSKVTTIGQQSMTFLIEKALL